MSRIERTSDLGGASLDAYFSQPESTAAALKRGAEELLRTEALVAGTARQNTRPGADVIETLKGFLAVDPSLSTVLRPLELISANSAADRSRNAPVSDADLSRRGNSDLPVQVRKSAADAPSRSIELRERERLEWRPRAASDERFTGRDRPANETSERTLESARAAVGRVMWGDFASVVRGGRWGCAASVSKVLEETGITGIKSAGVQDFARQALKHGYERLPVSEARPGDIVYGVDPRGGGRSGTSHIGIVGNDGRVYHNKSNTGRWKEDNLSAVFNSARFESNIWVLRRKA